MILSDSNFSNLNSDQFRKIIEQLAYEKAEKIFRNGSASNANIVIANIIKSSDSVNIYADNMDGSISDKEMDLIEAIVSFTKKEKNKSIRIFFENDPKKESSICRAIMNQSGGKIHTKKAPQTFISELDTLSPNQKIHFVTGDSDKFRIQNDLVKKSAYFSFNNKDITSILNNVFDKYWAEAESIKLN